MWGGGRVGVWGGGPGEGGGMALGSGRLILTLYSRHPSKRGACLSAFNTQRSNITPLVELVVERVHDEAGPNGERS